ncbi:hypothetical protein [Phaeobacter sp. 11ANDIMAR09]|uniref:hypothetical protein n=1 Tax=Phaeobacter sp. 11ANDIMAR09 TaxID=1225647 RepID=UPI0006C8A21D|nr:hypothetical protein [Phaeobacter sp. 11ANDIMAR09]KPD10281.1 hypothetical protein AN476_21870 [Phaeobacter sp. 11ANDIMAR09]
MKLETLAKRISQKTNTPILEAIVLGTAQKDELPEHCIYWDGAHTGKAEPRVRMKRGYDNIPWPTVVRDRPRAVINFKGKRHAVQRLLFDFTVAPDFPYKLENTCGEPLCVNPIHYLAKAVHNSNVRQPEPKGADQSKDDLDQHIADEGPWTVEEVGELVEMALTEHAITSWQSLIDLEILTEAPHELISEYLNTIGKQHLCA